MEETEIINKKQVEKHLQNSDFKSINNTIKKLNIVTAINLLSVDKNMDLFTKKSDFNFMLEIFKETLHLPYPKHLEFLKISNHSFHVNSENKINLKQQLSSQNRYATINQFITKSIDLSISKRKVHTLSDIAVVLKIGKEFNIEKEKIINWLGKIISHSNNPDLITNVSKNALLQNKALRNRFISIIINTSSNISILDKLFSMYGKNIYEIFSEHKSNNTIWNCLTPIKKYNDITLPYVSNEKNDWLNDKKIGYKNHPYNYFLIELKDYFTNKIKDTKDIIIYIEENSLQPTIFDSIQTFKTKLLPLFNQKLNEYLQHSYLKIYSHQEKTNNHGPDPLKEQPQTTKKLSLNETKQLIFTKLNIHVNNHNLLGFLSSSEYDQFEKIINEEKNYSSLVVFVQNPLFFDFCEKITLKNKLETELSINNQPSKPKKI